MNILTEKDYNFILNMLGLIGTTLNKQLNVLDNEDLLKIVRKEILELADIKVKIENITSNHYTNYITSQDVKDTTLQ